MTNEDESSLTDFANLILQGKDNEFMRYVEPGEIAENIFNLDPGRYLVNEEKLKLHAYLQSRECAALSEVAEILRPQLLPEAKVEGQEVREVAFGDIQEDGLVVTPGRTRRIAPDTVKRFERFILRPGDILLSVKGTIGRVGIVEDTFDELWIPSQSFVIIRLDPREQRVSAKYLFYFLSSTIGQGQILVGKVGSVVPILQASDVRDLRVGLPQAGEEEKVAEIHEKIGRLRRKILEAQGEIGALRQQFSEVDNSPGRQ